jgi:hypothetical protein
VLNVSEHVMMDWRGVGRIPVIRPTRWAGNYRATIPPSCDDENMHFHLGLEENGAGLLLNEIFLLGVETRWEGGTALAMVDMVGRAVGWYATTQRRRERCGSARERNSLCWERSY